MRFQGRKLRGEGSVGKGLQIFSWNDHGALNTDASRMHEPWHDMCGHSEALVPHTGRKVARP